MKLWRNNELYGMTVLGILDTCSNFSHILLKMVNIWILALWLELVAFYFLSLSLFSQYPSQKLLYI